MKEFLVSQVTPLNVFSIIMILIALGIYAPVTIGGSANKQD